MDRRAKKLEKKRKNREQAKKNVRLLAVRQAQQLSALARSAGSAPFGPCYVSESWDSLEAAALVTAVVTRELSSGHFVPAVALVDRTCLGVKDAFSREPMDELDLNDFIGEIAGGQPLLPCTPLVAQSIVFHAIDYARSLGFEPHRDFPAALFGPRPPELIETPWHAPERPIYVRGPRDDVRAITRRLTTAVGEDGFEFVDPSAWDNDEFDDDFDDEEAVVARLGDSESCPP